MYNSILIFFPQKRNHSATIPSQKRKNKGSFRDLCQLQNKFNSLILPTRSYCCVIASVEIILQQLSNENSTPNHLFSAEASTET